MKTQQKKGLLALLGVGAGIFAWYKYKNLSPEKKHELKSKATDFGNKIKDNFTDSKSKAAKKSTNLKDANGRRLDEVTQ